MVCAILSYNMVFIPRIDGESGAQGGAFMFNLFDSHVHSNNSFDGEHSVTFLCEKAVEAGLSGLCITDHCELAEYEKGQFETRITQSLFDVRKCKRIFSGRLAVSSGIELSDTLFDPALTDAVLQNFVFDMVMISHHNLADGTDIYYIDFKEWSQREVEEYMTYYFTSLAAIAKENKFDTLGHLTYPLRYICGKHQIALDLRRWDDLIEETLRIAAQNGKAIEMNTSGLFQEIAETMPPCRYIKRFRELGGEYVTLGSDAHTAENVGRGIETAMEMLLDAGFSCFTFYKQRQPLQLKII